MMIRISGALAAFFVTLMVVAQFGNTLADGMTASWIGMLVGIIALLLPIVAAVWAYIVLKP